MTDEKQNKDIPKTVKAFKGPSHAEVRAKKEEAERMEGSEEVESEAKGLFGKLNTKNLIAVTNYVKTYGTVTDVAHLRDTQQYSEYHFRDSPYFDLLAKTIENALQEQDARDKATKNAAHPDEDLADEEDDF